MHKESQRKLIVLSLKWYDQRIHQGVLEYAKDHDWDVVASPHMSQALDIPEASGQIVMLGDRDRRRAQIAMQCGKPVVDLGLYRPDLDLPRVLPDNYEGGRLAAEAFIERGFTNLAVFSTQSYWYVNDRTAGFRDAAKKKHLSCREWHIDQPDLHKGSFQLDDPVKKKLQKWLMETPKPLAVFAIEDESAALLLRASLYLGIEIPEEIALIGVNNDPLICPYTAVPLSSVDLNWEGVGFEAAALLDRLMAGKKQKSGIRKIPAAGFILRESSDMIAVEDIRVSRAIRYIWENSHRSITVTEISRALGLPLRTLQWAFQKHLQCSINDEIAKSRVREVESRLLNTDRKIEQIAKDLQFSSAQYLNHFFSKTTGITPNEYRRQHRLAGDS